MKRFCSFLLVPLMLITAALTIFYANSRAQNSNRQAPSRPTVGESDNTSARNTTARKGKVLVKRLPDGAEGVELKEGTLRLRDGYKFLKNPNGTVTVARMNDGQGVGGSWSCTCDDKEGGDCEAVISGGSLSCKVVPFSCNSCSMSVVVNKARTNIMRY